MNRTLEALPNHELLERTQALVRRGRALEAELLRHLGEVDARRLYLEQACYYEACRVFGEEHMARFRKREGTESETPVAEESPVRRPPFSAQRDLGSARQERLV